jgi:hypothetical protein
MNTTPNKPVEATKMPVETKNAEVFKVTGDWGSQAKKLKDKFSELTDADLVYEAGKENEMLSRVEARLHKNRAEVIGIIRNG